MAQTYTLKIKEIIRETPKAVTLRLKQPLFRKIKYKPGQYITLILRIDGKEVRRPYSMSSAPGIDGDLMVSVKEVDGGIASTYINRDLTKGTTVGVMEPMGHFVFEPDKSKTRHLVLFGGGSGITPLFSIIKSTLTLEPETKIDLVYSNRDEESIIFQDKLDDLINQYGNRLTVHHILSQPSGSWKGRSGRLTVESVKELYPSLNVEDPRVTYHYVCGPNGMMDAVLEGLDQLDVADDHVFKESFVAKSGGEDLDLSGGAQEVTVIIDGEENKLTVPAGKSILDEGLDQGLEMPFSCQSGLCTACRGKLKSGKVKMTEGEGLTDEEVAQGYVLLCVGHPETEDVVVEIG